MERSHVHNWGFLGLDEDFNNTYKQRGVCLQHCKSMNFAMAALVESSKCHCGNQENAER